MTLRENLRKLVDVSHQLRDTLGYGEFEVILPSGLIPTPKPKVTEKSVKAFSVNQIGTYSALLGAEPATLYQVEIGRLLPEVEIRSDGYWYLTRENYEAQCLAVQIAVEPLKYVVILGIVKEILK